MAYQFHIPGLQKKLEPLIIPRGYANSSPQTTQPKPIPIVSNMIQGVKELGQEFESGNFRNFPPVKQVRDFLTPQNEQEALRSGLAPIKTLSGEPFYFDPMVAGPIKKALPKLFNRFGKAVARKAEGKLFDEVASKAGQELDMARGIVTSQQNVPMIPKTKPFEGFKDLTTKFLDYAKGKEFVGKQEIMDFARRPELKKGEAEGLNKLLQGEARVKIPAQEFADSIRRDLLELKPVKVKEPQYKGTSIDSSNIRGVEETGVEFSKKYQGFKGSNYEEVVFESPITTNGSSHYPNSKNYFAHARGDEVVESGKKIWREQEIQSDLLQKDRLESIAEGKRRIIGSDNPRVLNETKNLEAKNLQELDQLSPFTNDRFGERIMRERIKEKASKGYEKYRLPTGETIGKIEGFEAEGWWTGELIDSTTVHRTEKLSIDDLKIGEIVAREDQEAWIITDILGDGRFKAVMKNVVDEKFAKWEPYVLGAKKPTYQQFVDKEAKGFLSETFDLTGKSNPQYRRYSDWGKFLKNKYGGKEVIDLEGNSWMEIDLRTEMGRLPIEAFGAIPFIPQLKPLFTNQKSVNED